MAIVAATLLKNIPGRNPGNGVLEKKEGFVKTVLLLVDGFFKQW